jgi:hypothetical protein
MNERIKQITGQVLDEIVPDTWTTLGYDKIKQIQYRTAELIVKECYALVDYENKQFIKAQFKEHFGVEE